jgi:DNA repair exonuclease SbcCD ATPase subunit
MGKVEFDVSYGDLQDIKQFCELNNIEFDQLIKKCFKTGYNIEKYGLLGKTGGVEEKWVEKEVIVEKRVEIPVEVIKEVEKIVEVIKEVPIEIIKEVEKVVEVIKEVPVEKIVVKTVTIYDNSNENELLLKIQNLDNTLSEKNSELQKIFHYNQELEEKCKKFSTKIEEMEKIFQDRPKVDDSKTQQLQQTIQTLMTKLREKDKEITELNDKINNITVKNEQDKPAVYLRSSNLNDNLYKD